MGIQPTQINTTERWSRTFKPILSRVSLGPDTVGVVGTFEDYGATVLTIPNPHQPVNIAAWAQSWSISLAGGAVDSFMRVSISINGGSSYSDGLFQNATTNAVSGLFRATFSVHHLVSGLPTGDIKVKARIQQSGGGPGSVTWNDGSILVQVTPLP